MNTSSKIPALRRLAFLGVTPELSPVFAKRIILTNLLGLLFTCNMSLSAMAFLYFDFTGLGIFTIIFVLCEFLWPILNYYHRYDLARIGLMVSSNLLGFAVSVLLPDTGYNRGFLVMAGLPVLLFSLKERKSILLGLILPVVLYPLSEWAQYRMPVSLGLTPEIVTIINYATGVIYVLLIFLMFYFLSSENARAEEQLEEQRARSFTSSKFAALGEMAAGISHEINNPMTAIGLSTYTLQKFIGKEGVTTEFIQERLNVINSCVRRITSIIESMRNFSREAHLDPITPESVLNIINDTHTFCQERFKNNNVRFEVHVPQDVLISCRATQVSQVLLNLLNNAFDAIECLPEKWIILEVLREEGRTMISVSDSGTGIPENLREKIFEPFYTTKPAGKGTGLGLSLSRGIIQSHNGTLTVEAKSPYTKFVISLPAV